MGHVERENDEITVDLDEENTGASDELLLAVIDALEDGNPAQRIVIRIVGAPRGMGALARSLATEAVKRDVSVHWRL